MIVTPFENCSGSTSERKSGDARLQLTDIFTGGS